MNIQSLNQSLGNFFYKNSKFNVDPLACSVAYFRNTSKYGFTDNKDDILPEDYDRAKQIRDYYTKKYFWNSLKRTRPQSEFKTNAQRLLAITEGWDLTIRDKGFFIKLPAFYAEDVVYDGFMRNLKTDIETAQKNIGQGVIRELTFLNKTFRWKHVKQVSYWLRDEHNHLYAYTTAYNHPFNVLFEEKVQRPQMLEFSCSIENIYTMYYNKIKSFSFLN